MSLTPDHILPSVSIFGAGTCLAVLSVLSPDRDATYIDPHDHYDRAEVRHRQCVWWTRLVATQGVWLHVLVLCSSSGMGVWFEFWSISLQFVENSATRFWVGQLIGSRMSPIGQYKTSSRFRSREFFGDAHGEMFEIH